MFKRKKTKPEKPEQHSDFPSFSGTPYLEVIDRLEAEISPTWYLEIGSRSGTSLARRKCNFIGVDPEFDLGSKVFNQAPQMHFMQMTSDAFFESNFLGKLGIKPELAFVDGLHIFDFALRDIMNCERSMSPGGAILVHDVLPFNYKMAEREYVVGTPWTGDVWKAMLALFDYRSDLKITMLGASKTGLACIEGLDANNSVLQEKYDEIIARYEPLELAETGVDIYFDRFDIVDPDTFSLRSQG